MKLFLLLLIITSSLSAEIKTDMGIMLGELSASKVHIQVRLNQTGAFTGQEGEVEFILKKVVNGTPLSQKVSAKSTNDFIARATFENLQSDTKYVCNTLIRSKDGKETFGPVARFKTLPGKQSSKEVDFVVVTGMNFAKFFHHAKTKKGQKKRNGGVLTVGASVGNAYTKADKHLGYPALESILSIKPDFFVGTGDNVYYDSPDRKKAETTDEVRLKYHEQFSLPRFKMLFAEVPTFWEIDDHDYRKNDCDRSGDYLPTPQMGRDIMLEQFPVAKQGDKDALTYRTVRASKELQVWFVENRMYRSDNKDEDGPEKSIWGKTQKEWLKRTLLSSDAKFKVLVSPTPMIGPDDAYKIDNHCNTGGFQHERDEFFAWLKETGLDKNGFYLACGDRHWQYHSVSKEGIEEFSCGALVDANARLGRKPGDPKSNDPNATIKQPYTQAEASGGFLHIQSTPQNGKVPAKLAFSFFDEKGKLLYQNVKN